LAWLHTEVVYPLKVSHPSTNRAQRRATLLMRQTMLPTTNILMITQSYSRILRVSLYMHTGI